MDGWDGTLCESTDRDHCYCEVRGNNDFMICRWNYTVKLPTQFQNKDTWMGTEIALSCECISDGSFTSYNKVYEENVPCPRNAFVALISWVTGIATTCFTMAMVHFIKGKLETKC